MTLQPGTGLEATPAAAEPTEAQPVEIADAVRVAVLGVPGVAGLHGGAFGEAATYFPGRTVKGIQVRPEITTVHVVLAWDALATETSARVRAAARAVTHTPVDVVVEDVAAPAGAADDPQA